MSSSSSSSSSNTKIPTTMTAVQLTSHGGMECLHYNTNVAVPHVGKNEVLVQVLAAGMNNTDINTRIGWYSKSVQDSTNTGGSTGFGQSSNVDKDASWSGKPLEFPRIQGADVCGSIVKVGENVSKNRLGQRIIIRSIMDPILNDDESSKPYQCWTFGSECNGGFAQYAVVPSKEAYHVKNTQWSDVELASIPCAYSTAEGMLHRVKLTQGETVLITGASGGVGSAAIQLAKRRGATVYALTSTSKFQQVQEIGADQVYDRSANLVNEMGTKSVDVVVDLVAGDALFQQLIAILKVGGRYVTAGAIGGPIVNLDVRDLYLKDLTLLGCTYQERIVFDNLVKYIEANEIQPLVSKTYPLSDIQLAQTEFLAKKFIGKLVLLPPPPVSSSSSSTTTTSSSSSPPPSSKKQKT